MPNLFKTIQPNIEGNALIRTPQYDTFKALEDFFTSSCDDDREVGIVLPVGCGKSGAITLTPFAFRSNRALVVAPGLPIADQLLSDFNPSNHLMFYRKCRIILDRTFPEPVEIRGTTTNLSDLEDADVVITNIQQLQGDSNKWLMNTPSDFFDLIIFDEGHHSVAATFEALKSKFPKAKVVNFSATPLRADGQMMAGKIIYSFPVSKAIAAGYVKQLKAVQLSPKTLKYVRRGEDTEIEVTLEEVMRLGETDADFRRSIVTSKETLDTIADASIHELNRLRSESADTRLKIIASALNFEHCHQVVMAYKARGLRADYVHSRQESVANATIMQKLKNHELDVIVQVRKLGEGFDHPYLAVAAVFSIFSNLSPFVQFVGRVMRVIVQNDPGHLLNRGVVVFHAGANIASKWSDFRQFSLSDQDYFDQLLPLEFIDPGPNAPSREYFPVIREIEPFVVKSQGEVSILDIPLLGEDEQNAIRLLQKRGLIPESFDPEKEILQPVSVTKVAQRQARRTHLDARIMTDAARLLSQRNINPGGRDLDRVMHKKTNLIVLKSAIDKKVAASIGKSTGQRSEYSTSDYDKIDALYEQTLQAAVQDIFNEQ